MNTAQLIQEIFTRLRKSKFFILMAGVFFAVILFFFAFNIKTVYTAKASIYPLNGQSDNTLSSASIGNLLGLSQGDKNFGSDVSVNIIELANSRSLREAIALTKLPAFQNKTIAELLLENKSDYKWTLFKNTTPFPKDSASLAIAGSQLLATGIVAKINKNGILELYYTCNNKNLVKTITEVIIQNISQFYIDLKTQKALADYNFIDKRYDSLRLILNSYDEHAVAMQNSTLFTQAKLEYELPKDNLAMEKSRLAAQINSALNYRDDAIWRLQKSTPIIATLDKPAAPFAVESYSVVLWGMIGFFIGCLLGAVYSIKGILFLLINKEIKKAVSGGGE